MEKGKEVPVGLFDGFKANPELLKILTIRWMDAGEFQVLRDLRATCLVFSINVGPTMVIEAAINELTYWKAIGCHPSYIRFNAACNKLAARLDKLHRVITRYEDMGLVMLNSKVEEWEHESDKSFRNVLANIGIKGAFRKVLYELADALRKGFLYEQTFLNLMRSARLFDTMLIRVDYAATRDPPIDLDFSAEKIPTTRDHDRVCIDNPNPFLMRYDETVESKMRVLLNEFYSSAHEGFKARSLHLRMYAPIDLQTYARCYGLDREAFNVKIIAPICTMLSKEFGVHHLWLPSVQQGFNPRKGIEGFESIEIHTKHEGVSGVNSDQKSALNSYSTYSGYVTSSAYDADVTAQFLYGSSNHCPTNRTEYVIYLRTRMLEVVAHSECAGPHYSKILPVLDSTNRPLKLQPDRLDIAKRASLYYRPDPMNHWRASPAAIYSHKMTARIGMLLHGLDPDLETGYIQRKPDLTILTQGDTGACTSDSARFLRSCVSCFVVGNMMNDVTVVFGNGKALKLLGNLTRQNLAPSNYTERPDGIRWFSSFTGMRAVEGLRICEDTTRLIFARFDASDDNVLSITEIPITFKHDSFQVKADFNKATPEALIAIMGGKDTSCTRTLSVSFRPEMDVQAPQCRADQLFELANGCSPAQMYRTDQHIAVYFTEWTIGINTTPIGLWSLVREKSYLTRGTPGDSLSPYTRSKQTFWTLPDGEEENIKLDADVHHPGARRVVPPRGSDTRVYTYYGDRDIDDGRFYSSQAAKQNARRNRRETRRQQAAQLDDADDVFGFGGHNDEPPRRSRRNRKGRFQDE